MLKYLSQHKVKIILFLVLAGFLWLVYLAFQEYAVESAACLEKGGKLVYDTAQKTLYCELPPPPEPVKNDSWWTWPWNW